MNLDAISPDEKKEHMTHAVIGLCWFDIFTYGMMVAFAIRNAVVYLWRQRRWKEFHLSILYTLIIIIGVSRIIYATVFFLYMM